MTRSAQGACSSEIVPVATVMVAAPGCGKTTFCLLFLHALARADLESGAARIHWFTAPTKQLVAEIRAAAERIMHPMLFAPAGQSPDGNERLWLHQQKLAQAMIGESFANLQTLKTAADTALENAYRNETERNKKLAEEALTEHFVANFILNHSEEIQKVYLEHEERTRIIISTTTYKLKYEAGEKLPVSRITRNKLPGGHASDEPDLMPFPASLCSSGNSAFLLAAYDPAQKMVPAHGTSLKRNVDKTGDSIPIKEEHYNQWLDRCSRQFQLMETWRHGARITDMLREIFPDTYPELVSASDAPDTTIHVEDCGKTTWQSASTATGALYNAKVFARTVEIIDIYDYTTKKSEVSIERHDI